ncbi:PepSY domain-containing protein [Magnetovibrio blakemorei]|uniref:PepSY domain-containing protein n=1 Tax=Magnetovibrio blakemorei TaxID=28181 RepID=A0A1E5QB43_9PROT|nr:PepSY domain-containing protein [Magnetovibrio blakemorei]OEJ69187.1 hypothetical protein BEN30_03580 [Magnetovibrio blakemorei]
MKIQSVRSGTWPLRALALSVLLCGSVAGVAFADKADQDLARAALLRGEVEPLSKALNVIEQNFKGNVIEVELEEDSKVAGVPKMIYEFKVLTPTGLVVKVKLDAKTLEILNREDKGRDHEKRRD